MRRLRSLLDSRQPVLVTRKPEHSVSSAAAAMARARAGIVAVLEDSRLIGVFSERDLLVRVIARGLSIEQTRLEDVMTREPLVAHEHEPLASAVDKMQSRSIRHLPILDAQGQLIDMLSIRDLLRAQVSDFEGDLSELRNYVSGGFDADSRSA